MYTPDDSRPDEPDVPEEPLAVQAHQIFEEEIATQPQAHEDTETEFTDKNAVLVIDGKEQPKDPPHIRKRLIERNESIPLTIYERILVYGEIVKSNKLMREKEAEKAAAMKLYNGQIAESRQIMDDAIDVIGRNSENRVVKRMEVMDWELGTVTYYDTEFDEVIEERLMTDEEKQMSF